MPLKHRYDPDVHRRRSIRLRGYDYSQPGTYFVTIVVQDRLCLFGDVVDGEMWLNDVGRIMRDGWEWLAKNHDYVELDAYVVMPNHLHGIIAIADNVSPTGGPRKTLGRLIGAFKTVTTKQVNLLRGTQGDRIWQRNFYERVIRNETELDLIREYIVGNPAKWDTDTENPTVHP